MNSVLALFVLVVAASAFQSEITIQYNRFGAVECRRKCDRANFNACPPVMCPKPPLNRACARPDCTLGINRIHVFPTADPNYFYQCLPVLNADRTYGWTVVERSCGCQTYFDYDSQRCVHINEWTSQCNATPNPPQPPLVCPIECPTCT